MLRIEPPWSFIQAWYAARLACQVPLASMSITAANPLGVRSPEGQGKFPAAPLTRMSRRPSCSTA